MIRAFLFAAGARRVHRESDLDTRFQRALKARLLQLAPRLSRRILVYRECKGLEYAPVNDHCDRARIDVNAKFKRVAARFDGLPHCNADASGARYPHPLPMRFIDDRLLFLLRHRRTAIGGWREVVREDLDEVGAALELDAYLLASFPRRVDE